MVCLCLLCFVTKKCMYNSYLFWLPTEVYISDFGMARLKEEEIHTTHSTIGPIGVNILALNKKVC